MIECQFCGEVLSGSSDDDLVRSIERHAADQHAEVEVDADRARQMVERRV